MDQKGQAAMVVLAVVAVIVLALLAIGGVYNGLVSSDVSVSNSWAKVQSAYQRRADLIPNLIETVKGYKNYEQETLTKIVELRSQAGAVQQQVKDARTGTELQAASSEMTGVLSRLMVIVEAYPDLKASQNFLALQDELAGTENRIKYERDNFNDAVKNYQVKVRSFPTNFLAGMFGFSPDKWKMFEAVAGAETAPVVKF